MAERELKLTPAERFFGLFTKVRPGEGRAIVILFAHAFLLLLAYYLIRPVREALILTEADAQLRSYATGFQALALMIIVPTYSAVFRSQASSVLVQRVNLFFAANLLIFATLGASGVKFGPWFFVWAGIFNVFVVANFWAFAADLLNVKSGKRLFALIAVGSTSGAWIGARINKELFEVFGPYGMMFGSAVVLASTIFLTRAAAHAIPEDSRADAEGAQEPESSGILGGFKVVFSNNYLLLIALMVFVINWLTAAGDNILSETILLMAERLVASGEATDEQAFIGSFYGGFFETLTAIGFFVQLFLVARFFRWFGVYGTLMIPVFLFLIGYIAIGFFPIFMLMQWVFIIHKSTDYSVLNTTRSALFLPVDRSEKYEGKTTIDSFFWRFGDLAAFASTWVFRNLLPAGPDYATYNIMIAIVLSFVLVGLAVMVGRKYNVLALQNMANAAPELNKPIPPQPVVPGQSFVLTLPQDTFIDNDPGDLLAYSAELHAGGGLPQWVRFDAVSLTFSGEVPAEFDQEILIRVTATDDEGLFVSDTLRLHFHAEGSG